MLTGLLIGGALACGDAPGTPVANASLLSLRSDMVTYDMNTYLFTPDGVRSGLIEADSAFFFQDSSVVYMEGMNMQLYDERGGLRATVTADRGRYDEESQAMVAQGSVVLFMTVDGRQVMSEELHYEPSTEQIWSDSASTYHHDDETTRGTCFRSDLSFRNYTVCNIRGSAAIGS